MAIELYTFPWSVPPTQVLMLAKNIGVDVKVKQLDIGKGENKSEEYKKLNPLGLVPTMVEGDFVLTESSAICYYLLNKYAPDSDLYPRDLKKRARIDEILAKMISFVHQNLGKFYKPCFTDLKKPTEEELKNLEDETLAAFERLVGDGKFALGDSPTLADFCLAAHSTTVVPCYFFNKEKFPRLAAYYETVREELPYFKEICQPGIEIRNKIWAMTK